MAHHLLKNNLRKSVEGFLLGINSTLRIVDISIGARSNKAGVNLKSTQYTQNTINGIMKELNVIADSGNSNLMKATLQRIETSRAINAVCGTKSSKVVSGIIKSFKVNPTETLQVINPIIKWAYKNNDQAMLTFFQMIMKNAGV